MIKNHTNGTKTFALGGRELTIESEGHATMGVTHDFLSFLDGIRITRERVQEPSHIPDPEWGTSFIVYTTIRLAFPGRWDLLSAGMLRREYQGRITAVGSLDSNGPPCNVPDGEHLVGLYTKDPAVHAFARSHQALVPHLGRLRPYLTSPELTLVDDQRGGHLLLALGLKYIPQELAWKVASSRANTVGHDGHRALEIA